MSESMSIFELLKLVAAQENTDQDSFYTRLYSPDLRLKAAIDDLKGARSAGLNSQEIGESMERVAALILRGARWLERPRSFQSTSAQYDLICSVEPHLGLVLRLVLGLDFEFSSFIVEAKAESEVLSNTHFLRLCHLVCSASDISQIGIFFTMRGASGFPSKSKSSLRKVSDCWLSQLLFYARYQRFVLVFDLGDIDELCQEGSFVRFLKQKMDAVRTQYGKYTEPQLVARGADLDLPDHLADIWSDCQVNLAK